MSNNKFSVTLTGVIAMVVVPLLVQSGFSEACAGEVWSVALMIPGAITAWYGRVRAGGVNAFGFKE